MTRTRRRLLRGAPVLVAALLCAACSSGSGSSATTSNGDSPYPSSIVALGHSGLTGFDSDPDKPLTDATENSWATGTNPQVDSIYQRLVALEPSVEGHVSNFAVDGSGVDSLADQEKLAAAVTPTPELVIIQSIDNDIRCDGTDPQNYGPYRRALTGVMDALASDLPDAEVFFVSQWGAVEDYDRVVMKIDPDHVTGTGPCDPISLETHRLDRRHEAYLQRQVDRYWAIVTDVCSQYPTCRTDEGALQQMQLTRRDLAADLDHLSVAGHRTMAALAWKALYG